MVSCCVFTVPQPGQRVTPTFGTTETTRFWVGRGRILRWRGGWDCCFEETAFMKLVHLYNHQSWMCQRFCFWKKTAKATVTTPRQPTGVRLPLYYNINIGKLIGYVVPVKRKRLFFSFVLRQGMFSPIVEWFAHIYLAYAGITNVGTFWYVWP